MKIIPIFTVFFGLTVLTGGIYPAFVTGAAWLAFPNASAGTLLVDKEKVIGSALIGQEFKALDLFWGRPSGTAPFPYNSAAGAGTNLAPSNPALAKRVADDVARVIAAHDGKSPVPVDLVTASGSGLDPHISIAAANYQVERVAKARAVAPAKLNELIERFTEKPTFGVLGQARINVLKLNLALIQESEK